MKTDMSKRIPQLIRLVFYALAPLLLLVFLARPVRNAVLASDPAAWMILLAVLAAVCLNWAVYAVIRRKRPSFQIGRAHV